MSYLRVVLRELGVITARNKVSDYSSAELEGELAIKLKLILRLRYLGLAS